MTQSRLASPERITEGDPALFPQQQKRLDHDGDWSNPFHHRSLRDALVTACADVVPLADRYDLIVGEDTSGRLPALVIRGVINARRQALGLPKARMRFISGRRRRFVPDGTFPEALSPSDRALVVTEFIASGTSVLRSYQAVASARAREQIDIVTLGSREEGIEQTRSRIVDQSVLHAPDQDFGIEAILYGQGAQREKGVEKQHGHCFSVRQPIGAYDSQAVRRARADINDIIPLIARQTAEIHLPPGS